MMSVGKSFSATHQWLNITIMRTFFSSVSPSEDIKRAPQAIGARRAMERTAERVKIAIMMANIVCMYKLRSII